MSNGYIPFTDIANFATIKGIDDFEEFLFIIRKIDALVVKHREKDGNTST